MACALCRGLPIRTVRQLNADLMAGDLSLDQISQNYGADTADLETHTNVCLVSARSGYNVLTRLLDEINAAAAERREAHELSDEGASEAMDQYIALVREARATVLAMDKLKPSEELVRAIIQQILTPFINKCVAIIVDESGRLRDDFQSYIDVSQHPRMGESVNVHLKRVAVRLKRDTSPLVPQLRKLLNVQKTAQDDAADELAITEETDTDAPPQVN